MKRNLLFVLLSFSLIAFTTSCKQEKPEKAEKPSKEQKSEDDDMFDAARKSIDQLEKSMNQAKDANKAEVDMESLKDWIPSDVLGMKRTNREISKAGIMGFNTVTAKGSFQDGDTNVDVDVVHMGGMTALISAMAAWSTMEVYKEGDDYYEKTTEIDGNKALVKYNSSTKDGEINILLPEYIINVRADNIDKKKFEKLPKELKLDKLPKPKS